MARRSFGHRSGVVVDRCQEHGVWLDNGELIHLLEWKKAGGQMLHQQQSGQSKKKRPEPSRPLSHSSRRSGSRLGRRPSGARDLEDLVADALSSLVRGIFG